jgi:hypothetical protein
MIMIMIMICLHGRMAVFRQQAQSSESSRFKIITITARAQTTDDDGSTRSGLSFTVKAVLSSSADPAHSFRPGAGVDCTLGRGYVSPASINGAAEFLTF